MQPKGASFFPGELMARPRKTGLDWIAIDVNSPDHPKMKRIAKHLGISAVDAFGHFVAFLCYVGEFYPSGNVTDSTDSEINEAARCAHTSEKDCKTFADILRAPDVRILRTTRRGTVRVNGWAERNGKFWHQLQRDRRRKAAKELSNGKPKENGRKTGGFSHVPDLALPCEDKTPQPPRKRGAVTPTASPRKKLRQLRQLVLDREVDHVCRDGTSYRIAIGVGKRLNTLVLLYDPQPQGGDGIKGFVTRDNVEHYEW